MYNKPITEVFDLKGENLMQGVLNPISSGGNSSGDPNIIYDGD